MQLDYLLKLDTELSYVDEGVRILYLQSEEHNIIEAMIDGGDSKLLSMIRGVLGNYCRSEPGLYRKLKNSGDIVEFYTVCDLNFRLDDTCDKTPRVFTLTDFQLWSKNERAQLIKSFLDSPFFSKSLLLISSPTVEIPDGMGGEIALIKIGVLSDNDIRIIYNRKLSENFHDSSLIEKRVHDLRGLTRRQIDEVFSKTSAGNTLRDRERIFIKAIKDNREQAAQKDAAMIIRDITDEPDALAIGEYTDWLSDHKEAFLYPDRMMNSWGIHAPKGVLMVGVPGTGKTQSAIQSARLLVNPGDDPLPLIELRIDKLESSNYGESEAQLNRYLERAESMAPCVLLIDEIEKTFEEGSEKHQVRKAQLSILLKWLQQRKGNVLTFITANSIKNVPPELLRDGRLSERFFVFLPSCEDLADILCNKIAKISAAKELKRYGIEEFKAKEKAKELFNEIARAAEKAGIPKFFTGANVDKLLDETNLKLYLERNGGKKISYKEALKDCAMNIVTQGETGLSQIIRTWFDAKENRYRGVSKKFMFPFAEYESKHKKEHDDAKEIFKSPPDNEIYDKYLFDTICKEIDKYQREKEQEEDHKKMLQ